MTSKHRTPLLVTTKTPRLLLVRAPDPGRDALGRLLANEGYALTTADTNEDAFHKLQSAPPDILLLSASAGSAFAQCGCPDHRVVPWQRSGSRPRFGSRC